MKLLCVRYANEAAQVPSRPKCRGTVKKNAQAGLVQVCLVQECLVRFHPDYFPTQSRPEATYVQNARYFYTQIIHIIIQSLILHGHNQNFS